MSSLAAARADNFYFSKNYNPEKIPEKVRADTPFTVVEGQRVGGSKCRYQTPFHVRCEGCSNMVAKGVRFNSIKTWVGNFHSTKIYEFRMKCPQCPQRFVVRTDPENCEYMYVSGARRIFQVSDCRDESRIRDESVQKKVDEDPFFKLEVQHKDKEENGTLEETIEKLITVQERNTEDFELNRLLRQKIKAHKEIEKEYYEEKERKNLRIPLLKPIKEDEVEAGKVNFKTKPIKKETNPVMSERDRLKQKMANLHPNFKKILKKEIKQQNKPSRFNK